MVDDMMHCTVMMCKRVERLLEGQVQLQGWIAPRFPSCLNTLGKDKMKEVVLTQRERGRR